MSNNAICNINTTTCENIIYNYICPICQELLLNPVVAKDGVIYNKECFVSYTKGKYEINSPVKGFAISTQCIEMKNIRDIIISLMKNTNLFDNYIKDFSQEYILENN